MDLKKKKNKKHQRYHVSLLNKGGECLNNYHLIAHTSGKMTIFTILL